jgi:hypothetical protein
MCPRKQEN